MQICTSFSTLSSSVQDPVEWSTLYLAFYAHRAAVLVSIQDDGSATLLPFVNTRYDNRLTWAGCQLQFQEGSKERHYQEQKRAFGTSDDEEQGFVQDCSQWWLNGYTLCNIIPYNLWSLRGLSEIQDMLTCAQQFLAPFKGHYVLNKRDSPLLRSNIREHCFPALGKTQMPPVFIRPTRPPLSFYTGPEWSDIAFPLPEAWSWSTASDKDGGGFLLQRCFKDNGILSREDFFAKKERAVFRGTATGAGMGLENQRLRLCALHLEALDAGITAWNKRDKVMGGIISFQSPLGSLMAAMTPRLQSEYRIVVYVDGHQCASRLVWQLASGCVILKVASGPLTLAPCVWLSSYLQKNVHYVEAKADLSDFQDVLTVLLNDPELCYRLAKSSYALANTVLRPATLARDAAKAIATSFGQVLS